MFTDIYTIIRKEWMEIFLQRNSWKSGLINQLVVLGVLGIFLPIQTGPGWLSNPVLAITWLWLPVTLTINMVAEAFAGERERHTLDTLLSSRLSDSAILIGKILASVLYGFSLSVISLLVAAVTINLTYSEVGIQFYPLPIFLTSLVVILLNNLLMAALGVLISLRAATARQSYQQLLVALLILFSSPILFLI